LVTFPPFPSATCFPSPPSGSIRIICVTSLLPPPDFFATCFSPKNPSTTVVLRRPPPSGPLPPPRGTNTGVLAGGVQASKKEIPYVIFPYIVRHPFVLCFDLSRPLGRFGKPSFFPFKIRLAGSLIPFMDLMSTTPLKKRTLLLPLKAFFFSKTFNFFFLSPAPLLVPRFLRPPSLIVSKC